MEKFKVLLVDDEKKFVQTLAERIKLRKLDSKIAFNGTAALEMVDNEIPDVMVLDLKMPGIYGLEVLEKVKKTFPQVEVIILTGHGSKRDEEEARRLGAFEYLEKPADIDVLIDTMRRAFRKKTEDAMVAAAFAEAGDFKTARQVVDEEKDRK